MREFVGSTRFSVAEASKATLRMFAKSRELKLAKRGAGLDGASHVVVLVVRNEAERIPYFLQHHRALGFDHFLAVDNGSDDGTRETLLSQTDVTVYDAKGDYGRSRYGNDWVNVVLNRHCVGKWVLYVDADELLVFPHDESGVARLTGHLDSFGARSMRCLMVDMYGPGKVRDNYCPPGTDPATVCPLYDADGYETRYEDFCMTSWTKGGVRGRVFFQGRRWEGPALNKTPLVRWGRGHAFLKSAHQLWPLRLNVGTGVVSGALLHFKFTAALPAKVAEESARRQHTTEYASYDGRWDDGGPDLADARSHSFEGWRSFAKDGIVRGTGWVDDYVTAT